MRRVVVTGLGAITPLGCDVDSFWKGVLESRSAAGPITLFNHENFKVHFACEVKDFDPDQYFSKKEQRRLDRFCQFAIAAAQQAVEESGIKEGQIDPKGIGCVLGSGIGGIKEIEDVHTELMHRGPRAVSPFLVPKMMINASCGEIAIRFGFKGLNFAVTSACASGSHAIIVAFHLIRAGVADVIVAGGSEAAITELGLAGFIQARALSTRNDQPEKASRPFSADRDGFVMGEGAGALVLEDLQHALSRKAKVYAELVGTGMTDDSYHITAPDPQGAGASECMRQALREAGIGPEEVQYINAHGTSTPLNDVVETKAIKAVFGEHAYKLAVSSTKSQIGHLLGASGAVEAIATVLAVKNDVAPPTINYENPDPECDLDYVPNKPRPMKIIHALSNSFGFGGHNATLLFKKYEEG